MISDDIYFTLSWFFLNTSKLQYTRVYKRNTMEKSKDLTKNVTKKQFQHLKKRRV